MRLRNTFMALACGLAIFAFSGNSIAASVEGTSSGVFTNPTGPSGMVTSGVGTNNFAWGNGAPFRSPSSSLTFTGNAISTEYNTLFSFGTLNYYNGTIAIGTEATGVDLGVNLALTTPTGVNETFAYTLSLINTRNTSDPIASADYVVFPSVFPTSSFNVGGVDYTLAFAGFGTLDGSGFTVENQFHVLENSSAGTELIGRITVAQVPEPSTLLLLGSGIIGMGGLGFVRRKFRA